MADRSLNPCAIAARQRSSQIAECDEGDVTNGQIEHKRITGCLPRGIRWHVAADFRGGIASRNLF
jgi:hypothetical protein